MKVIRRLRQTLSDLFAIWSEELRSIRSDIGVVIFFLVVPIAYPIIYGAIYNPETIRDVPLVVVDDSHSSLARELVGKIDATPEVMVYTYVSDMAEAQAVIDRHEAYGVLYIPADFSLRLNRGEQATVALYADMSGLLFYKSLLLAVTEASMDMNASIDSRRLDVQRPAAYESVALYNPQSGFASFLVPGILVLVIQQTLLLGICMLAATRRERAERAGQVVTYQAFDRRLRLIAGRALAYFTIYIAVSIWALEIVPAIFGLPQSGHYGTILLFRLPYVLACIFFSMTIAGFIRGRETPMMVLVFTSLPLLFLSGISWPATAIPDGWRFFSYLFPSTFGIQGFVKINSMGASLDEIAFEYRALWIQAGIYFIACCMLRRCAPVNSERRTGVKPQKATA